MEKSGLIPDVLQTLPKKVLSITYKGDVKVAQGNVVTIQQVSEQPKVDWEADPTKFYTLYFADPDAESRANPSLREWVHWLVVNIPGSSKNISEGETLMEFIPSCPREGSGEHRYIFVLYEQPSKVDFSGEDKLTKSKEDLELRGHFLVRYFARKYKLGEPYAANFYMTQWDSYVPIIYKELGIE